MDTTSKSSDHRQAHKSELDKFQLFYELAVPTHEIRARIKRQSSGSR